MAKKGSAQQDKFVLSYIKHLHENDACKKASEESGLSYNYCRQLLTFPHIIEKIDEAKRKRCEETRIDANTVLTRLSEMMEADVADIMMLDGSIKPIEQWPRIWRQMLNAFDLAELWEGRGPDKEQIGLLKKIRFIDRMKVIENVGKHISVGAFKEKVEHSVDSDVADILMRARKRVKGEKK